MASSAWTTAQLTADFWIARLAQPDRVVFDRPAIAAQNDKLQRLDASILDLRSPAADAVAQAGDSTGSSPCPNGQRGRCSTPTAKPVDAADTRRPDRRSRTRQRFRKRSRTRYGLVVHRADLRTFPTDAARVQRRRTTPTSTASRRRHCFPARRWSSCIRAATAYGGSSSASAMPPGSKRNISPRAVRSRCSATSTGNRTASSPVRRRRRSARRSNRRCRELRLDMGARVPLLADWPADKAVNGQHPYTSHVIELPLRDDNGALQTGACAAAEEHRYARRLPAADAREHPAPGVQVPRRTLRLGPRQ